ncbi:GNAT family N-acetyltransferase [Halobacillus rhizosphaerae]|uniref:GNAT family N-acetyltransferase n=1 Tax=Halobacillus rhizosphaerae TaxID=3064889 RepID=UPI00398A8960
MYIGELEVKDLHKVANWLHRMNEQDKHFVAWLASDPNEIFEQIWTLTQFKEPLAFVAWNDKQEIIGFLGILPFFEQKLCRLLGPFALSEEEAMIEQLWNKASLTIQLHFDVVKVACFEANHALVAFSEKKGFQLYNVEKTLAIHRSNFEPTDTKCHSIVNIGEEDKDQLDLLHPSAAYYTLNEMMELAGKESNKLWGYQVNGELIGYLYFETIIPDEEGEICFVNVAPGHRGKGIGSTLIEHAVQYAFHIYNLDAVTISVRTQNKQAERLYMQFGFREINKIFAYQKKLEKPQVPPTLH